MLARAMSETSASSAVLQFPYGPSLASRVASTWIYWVLSLPCMFAGAFMLHATLTSPGGPDGTFIACSAPFVLVPPLLFAAQLWAHARAPRIRIEGTAIVAIDRGARRPLGDAAGADAVVIERSLEHGTFTTHATESQAHLQSATVTKSSTSEVYDVKIGEAVVTHVVNDFRLARERAQACARHLGLPIVEPGDRFAA